MDERLGLSGLAYPVPVHANSFPYLVGGITLFGFLLRLLATRLGAAAAERLARDEHGVLVGLLKGDIEATPLSTVVANQKVLDLHLLDLARVLAT